MRGPVHVDDILREMHQSAFTQQPASSAAAQQQQSRIEVVSNASESDISEVGDIDVAAILGKPAKPAAAPRRKRQVKTAI